MPSVNQSSETAKWAAKQIFGFYPAIDASDEAAFTAGFVMLLASYPEWLIERAADPVIGIAGSCKFIPRLAEAKEWLDSERDREQQHRDLINRYTCKSLPSPEMAEYREPGRGATRSALLEQYEIREIPPGWDAVDIAIAKARFGSGFHDQIEATLKNSGPVPRSMFSRVVDNARAAIRRREMEIPDWDEVRAHYARRVGEREE